MQSYITIKVATLKRVGLGLLAATLLGVAVYVALALATRREYRPTYVETASRNALVADGRTVAFFRSIDADTLLTGLTVFEDSVRCAPELHPRPATLRRAVDKTLARLEKTMKNMEGAAHEMDYFLDTHGVQDEGYDMVAAHKQELQRERELASTLAKALANTADSRSLAVRRTARAVELQEWKPSGVFYERHGLRWHGGRLLPAPWLQRGVALDVAGRLISARWQGDTIASGRRAVGASHYAGDMDRHGLPSGHGHFAEAGHGYYEGHWEGGMREGFGFAVDRHKLRAGEWLFDTYKGERMHYTSDRIYGIDISKYQHGKGRKHTPIAWGRLRITHLGRVGSRNAKGSVDYPVSFIYIKSTEGKTVRNPYFKADYTQARRHGFRTGAYHFFSTKTPALAQANYFLKNTYIRRGDMPPVLDVEPTDAQIKAMGGPAALFRAIRTWMEAVRRRTGARPVLYVGQRFVNKYLADAPDIKRSYNVWIARYGEYKPDVRLVYWQLCADGTVRGIQGEVDINVFNGYKDKFQEFVAGEAVR